MTLLAMSRARAYDIPAYQPATDLAAFMVNRARKAAAAVLSASPNPLPERVILAAIGSAAGNLDQALALRRDEAKAAARKFAMLFDPDWLAGLSRQIDSLLDPDEWLEEDLLLNMQSFQTLLVVLMTLRTFRRPGLGLTTTGNIVATWSRSASDRLMVECLPTGRVRWIATVPMPAGNESGTHDTTPDRLLVTLDRFNPEHWLAQHER